MRSHKLTSSSITPIVSSLSRSTSSPRRLQTCPFRSLHQTINTLAGSDLSSIPKLKRTPEENAAYFRQRKAEWKRRQGKGGDGCTAFQREKFKPYGPPSGGNGGRGGSVYIRAIKNLTSLASVSKRVTAPAGMNGQGTWRNGSRVPDIYIDVPVGTIVREVRRVRELEEEQERRRLEALTAEERAAEERDKMWVHYPAYRDINEGSEAFLRTEQALEREEAARRKEIARRRAEAPPLVLDLSEPDPEYEQHGEGGGILIAAGGQGGLGNPYFSSSTNRSPKFATRGKEGERFTLELELKILADVGLVGFPNAGKSTILRALTNSKAEVASYAFTTLNPQVGIVRVFDDGTFDEGHGGIVEDGKVPPLPRDISAPSPPTPEGDKVIRTEAMRFTIADNPGLLEGASDNVGLGHSFLRSIERSLALVYVVDFSKEAPWDDVEILRGELEAYKEGLSDKARLIIANKADLAVDEKSADSEGEVRAAKVKLARLKKHAEYMGRTDPENGERVEVEVLAVSGKYRQNLTRVVHVLGDVVQLARERDEQTRTDALMHDIEENQVVRWGFSE